MEKNGFTDITKELSEYFKVDEQEILLTLNRLNVKDHSIDAKVKSEYNDTRNFLDNFKNEDPDMTTVMVDQEHQDYLKGKLDAIKHGLSERELFLVQHRLSADDPITLSKAGEHFGVSRERMRQIEESLIKKLQRGLDEFKEMTQE